MKTLLKNGYVINVFTDEIIRQDVLLEDGVITGVGDYSDLQEDLTIMLYDCTGKYICPGFVDSHIHIESTMLTPAELARVCVPHGTTSIIADPHEIANVCGKDGISYMLEASENLPMNVFIMLPSCVPATPFDESGAVLKAADLHEFYRHPRVLGLAEMMNYPGVIAEDPDVMEKINDAKEQWAVINGHAPLLSGKDLDKYISAGIMDDHECSSYEEGLERIRKGQTLMIREGTSARNLSGLIDFFVDKFSRNCVLVTDDKHPQDLLSNGHIDYIIRESVKMGASPLTGIRMATIQACRHFGLINRGAVAPGYVADICILTNLEDVTVDTVFSAGTPVAEKGRTLPFKAPAVNMALKTAVKSSFSCSRVTAGDFFVEPESGKIRVINVVPGQLLTPATAEDFREDTNGIDIENDILKLAVIERHHNTGHKGIGYIKGIGLKKGAIASSVSHDSHNLIVIGTNDDDMALAANNLITCGGGSTIVCDGETVCTMELPIGGLMTDLPADFIAAKNEALRQCVSEIGVAPGIEPFMNMAFVSLPVIPSLKMTTQGLVDVDKWQRVPLFI